MGEEKGKEEKEGLGWILSGIYACMSTYLLYTHDVGKLQVLVRLLILLYIYHVTGKEIGST